MNHVLALDIAGLHVPDAGPMFFAALAVHVAAGATAVVAGILATTARRQPGRHPRAGTVYLYAITAVFLTASVMAALRWRHDWHLSLIATITFGQSGQNGRYWHPTPYARAAHSPADLHTPSDDPILAQDPLEHRVRLARCRRTYPHCHASTEPDL